MNVFGFLKTKEWVIVRRLVLIGVILFLALRSYGDSILGWLHQPSGERDVAITQYEFRPELNGAKPAWIIGFKNNSTRFTYDRIELEATYIDVQGTVIEKDKLVVNQKLAPGEEQLVASVDFRNRQGATKGTVRVITATRVNQ